MSRSHGAGWGLTRTAMASGRGPLVLRLSLASCTAYSHSRPIAVKVRLVASLPLGLRMKLSVTWFFTAGQGERGTQISGLLHRSTSQISLRISRPSQWAPWGPLSTCHSFPPETLSSQMGHHMPHAASLPLDPASYHSSYPHCFPFFLPNIQP